METIEAAEDHSAQEEMTDQKKCTKQPAVTAEKNAMFLSNQQKEDQSFAKIAFRIIRNSKLKSKENHYDSNFIKII
jgi:hypothetical protein